MFQVFICRSSETVSWRRLVRPVVGSPWMPTFVFGFRFIVLFSVLCCLFYLSVCHSIPPFLFICLSVLSFCLFSPIVLSISFYSVCLSASLPSLQPLFLLVYLSPLFLTVCTSILSLCKRVFNVKAFFPQVSFERLCAQINVQL